LNRFENIEYQSILVTGKQKNATLLSLFGFSIRVGQECTNNKAIDITT